MALDSLGPVSASFYRAAAYENRARFLRALDRVPDCVRSGFSICSANLLQAFPTSRFILSLFTFDVSNSHFSFISVQWVSSRNLIPKIFRSFFATFSFIAFFGISWIATTAMAARKLLCNKIWRLKAAFVVIWCKPCGIKAKSFDSCSEHIARSVFMILDSSGWQLILYTLVVMPVSHYHCWWFYDVYRMLGNRCPHIFVLYLPP